MDPFNPNKEDLKECADTLRNGGLVAFPTETVYGLGANALDPHAVAGIFEAKGRPQDNPLIVHVSRVEQLPLLVERIDSRASQLIERFWPGPLTLLFPKKEIIPDIVTAGLPLVAVRMPDHPVAQTLIDLAGVPIAAPSANLSGKPSPTRAEDVLLDLGGKIHFVVDGGAADIGVESTVLDISGKVPRILRPGGISREELEEVLGPVDVVESTNAEVKGPVPSPGMKYTHYAPRAPVYLAKGSPEEQREQVILFALRSILNGKKVLALASSENYGSYSFIEKRYSERFHAVDLGSRKDLAPVAAKLFSSLRYADVLGVDAVVSETFPTQGLGLAINNRLERASGGRQVTDGKKPFTVMMVCSGNTCRSPMAEALMRKMWEDAGAPFPLYVFSRGTAAMLGFPASSEALNVMNKRGIDLSAHISWPVSQDDMAKADMVIAMTKSHKGALMSQFPQYSHKIWTLSEIAPDEVQGDVDDPIGKGLEAYEKTALTLEKGIAALIKRLTLA